MYNFYFKTEKNSKRFHGIRKKLTVLQSKGAETLRGDIRNPSWMDSALKNVQNLFIASHGLVPPSLNNNMETVDNAGNRNIIDAAQRTGVERIFFTSTYFAKPDALARFGRIKYKIEQPGISWKQGVDILKKPLWKIYLLLLSTSFHRVSNVSSGWNFPEVGTING